MHSTTQENGTFAASTDQVIALTGPEIYIRICILQTLVCLFFVPTYVLIEAIELQPTGIVCYFFLVCKTTDTDYT